MRVLRSAAGLVLLVAGVAASLGGVAGWVIGDHRTGDGSFVAELAPVHTDGYAISVPDVSGLVARHGAGRLLGDGELRLTVRADRPVVVALVPAVEASRYLTGVERTEVVGVGFASGAQPVQTWDQVGGEPRSAIPRSSPWLVVGPGEPLALDLPSAQSMSLVVLRSDRDPDFTVTVTASLRPPSWGLATAMLLLVGGLGLCSGTALVLLRRPRDDLDDLSDEWSAEDFCGEGAAAPSAPTTESPYIQTAT
jgi:hypothetical protein